MSESECGWFFADMPNPEELQEASRVCLRVAYVMAGKIPWWKRWMYSLATIKMVGEKLAAMAVITTRKEL